MPTLLPPGGKNIFQEIKRLTAEAEAAGLDVIKLTIGEPSGPAFAVARDVVAQFVKSDDENVHRYQDNDTPGLPNFAARFVRTHVHRDLPRGYAYLPLPGIKPVLGMVIQAMGGWCSGAARRTVFTLTKPGYPTPADQARMQSGVDLRELAIGLGSDEPLSFLEDFVEVPEHSLLMVNFPHNPTGRILNRSDWARLCEFCVQHKTRLFNDAAYARLSHEFDACTLSEVATEYPQLEWAEAFSGSKLGNFTGYRVGALVGSPDFVSDIARIKGNTDSGLFAPAAAGIIYVVENRPDLIGEVRNLYKGRLVSLRSALESEGMRLAATPEAGFFALFEAPSRAFGMEIEDAAAFNGAMIKNTGIIGVPFGRWIRYAVCQADTTALFERIKSAFGQARVEYTN